MTSSRRCSPTSPTTLRDFAERSDTPMKSLKGMGLAWEHAQGGPLLAKYSRWFALE